MEKIAIETECSIKRMCKISMKKCNTKGQGMEKVHKSSEKRITVRLNTVSLRL